MRVALFQRFLKIFLVDCPGIDGVFFHNRLPVTSYFRIEWLIVFNGINPLINDIPGLEVIRSFNQPIERDESRMHAISYSVTTWKQVTVFSKIDSKVSVFLISGNKIDKLSTVFQAISYMIF